MVICFIYTVHCLWSITRLTDYAGLCSMYTYSNMCFLVKVCISSSTHHILLPTTDPQMEESWPQQQLVAPLRPSEPDRAHTTPPHKQVWPGTVESTYKLPQPTSKSQFLSLSPSLSLLNLFPICTSSSPTNSHTHSPAHTNSFTH